MQSPSNTKETIAAKARQHSLKPIHTDLYPMGRLCNLIFHGKTLELVILGNSVNDTTGQVWCADNTTGMRHEPRAKRLTPISKKQTLTETKGKCELWAEQGNEHAMWWLGYIYEYGSDEFDHNRKKAMAYYFAAMRKNPDVYGGNYGRVVNDGGYNLFDENPTPEKLAEAKEFRKRFVEFDQEFWGEWQDAIKLARAL